MRQVIMSRVSLANTRQFTNSFIHSLIFNNLTVQNSTSPNTHTHKHFILDLFSLEVIGSCTIQSELTTS